MFDVFYLDRPTGLFPHERWAKSLAHARSQSRTRFCWVLDYLSDYQGFDFLWEPPPWQAHQAHAWPSQHQAAGGTWLLPCEDYQDVNRDHCTIPRINTVPRLHIRHSAGSEAQGDINTRYVNDYLGTMRRALRDVDWTWCWVTADVCDYTDFDFTWHPSEWQQEMLHVFSSSAQKFGDTFYVHVPTFLERSKDLAVLEWYPGLNFVDNIDVARVNMPRVRWSGDSIVPAIQAHEFDAPLVQFHQGPPCDTLPTVSLWQPRTKTVIPLSRGHSTAIVPRECKNHLRSQVYDYAHVDLDFRYLQEPPLDIVFISNGESSADSLWQRVLTIASNRQRRCVRVDGVNGRAAAYHAAARASTTPWFFAVFAKLEVEQQFDWDWQPDRFQQPKHYIFHALNPCNGLEYGHQAMIAYNRDLVLANPGRGLDFTLDDAHEVVPVLSGVARYNTTAWSAWRTAFREVIKLRHSLPDVENEYRMNVWLANGWGQNGDWSVAGAQDAVEYYQQVQGDFAELRKTYEWSWLASYALVKRGLAPDQ
jgi:hypothetical protein